MDITGAACIVTGGASGIGRAIAARLIAGGARGVAIADLPGERLTRTATELGALALPCDATDGAAIATMIAAAQEQLGEIGIFVSNAGIYCAGGEEAPDAEWALNWNLHVMAHVHAARAILPGMAARGAGAFVITASAAGVLTHLNSASYATTKHAAVGLGEFLAIKYGPKEPGGPGVAISVLAPQAVRTPMTAGLEDGPSSVDGMLAPEDVANDVAASIADGRFLILPHPQVLEYMRRKSADYDRWISGMRRMKARRPDGI